MTTWRERGYVPASDGEDSEAELLTQEEPLASPEAGHEFSVAELINNRAGDGRGSPAPRAEAGGAAAMKDTVDGFMDVDIAAQQPDGGLTNEKITNTIEENLLGDEFMDIDKALGIVTRSEAHAGNRLSLENLAAILPANIPIFDLSNQPDDADDEDGGVELQGINLLRQAPPKHQHELDVVTGSPDPITGEPQTRTTPGKLPNISNERRAPEASSTLSSPLSSPPMSPVRTMTPPSSLYPPRTEPRLPSMGFQVVINQALQPASPIHSIPSIEATSPFFQRSLRQRKPIQVHPYMLEGARYKQQMKAKGVEPVRIQEAQNEAVGKAATEQEDSQDREYEAPLGEDSQSPRRRFGVAGPVNVVRNTAGNEFADAVQRRRLKDVSKDGLKRRKLDHTYSRKSVGEGLNRPLSSGPLISLGASSAPQARAHREIDIFDLESPLTRPPLARSHGHSNSKPPPTSARAVQASPARRDGLLSLLDAPSESDLEPPSWSDSSQGSPVTVQKLRPRGISISSDESPSRRQGLVADDAPGRRSRLGSVSGGSERGGSSVDEDSSQESRRPPRDASKLVRWFKKRGTRGVLPASYVRFAGRTEPTDENRENLNRAMRQSTTPQPEERRPGVARAKLSSRIREPVQDLFPQDNDSDSSDELILSAAVPVKQKPRRPASSAPQKHVVDLLDDDIPEDNRIDYGLPTQERRRPSAPRARHKGAKPLGQTGTNAKRTHNTTQGSRRNGQSNTSSRRRNPRQSSGPRLSIVDAAAHHKKIAAQSPPRFLKVATRSAQARKDNGRQSPARKLFILDSANDTREIQGVLRDWREGTLPFGIYEAHPERSGPDRRTAEGPLSPQRLVKSRGSKAAARFSISRKAQPTQPTLRAGQTSLLRHNFQRQASSMQARPPKPRQTRPLAAVPLRDNYVTHQPSFTPQPAQFERDIPGSQLPPRQHPTSLVIENVIHNLHRQRTQQRSIHNSQLSSTVRHAQKSATQAPQPHRPTQVSVLEPNSVPRRPILRRRKNTPRRIDADTIERRQPPTQEFIINDEGSFEPIIVEEHITKNYLCGLLPLGSHYSLNFDTLPLKHGTIFNAETFIGKGYLSLALSIPSPQVSAVRRSATYSFGDKPLYWSVYEDSVATDFESIMRMIGDVAEKRSDGGESQGFEGQTFAFQAYEFYGFVTKYISETLSFHDPLDTLSFSQRFLQSIETCCSRLSLNVLGPSDTASIRNTNTRLVLQANTFCLVIAFQIFQLSSTSTDAQEQLELPRILRKIGRELLSRLLRCGVDSIRTCYEDQRRQAQFERGIGNEHYFAELWVLAIQTLNNIGLRGTSFWDILNDELHIDRVENSVEVQTFERLWRILFTLIPLYQFDDLGVTQRFSENHSLLDNWAAVKVLAGKPLRIYNANKNGHSGTINAYLRMVYARCYHLIKKWGWINPDSIIPVLFEFFSSNGLANLSDEEDRGSPNFLLNLDRNPSITVDGSDQCFQLLLKIIVVGLDRMKVTSTNRKISGLVYRLMPNHRRQYPKDEGLQLAHLTALKNHHYLLETLYWAAPLDCRPPLDAIRLLVDPETSHREACSVAVRALSNIIRFQLHSGESLNHLEQLMEWFDDLVTKTLGQHQLVRSEAEKQFRLAQEHADSNLSEDDLEENVRRNQKQLEALLNDLIKSLCIELASIPGQVPSAIVLLTQSATANILNSYTRLSNKLLLEVLSLLQQFLKTCKVEDRELPNIIAPATSVDNDSQDYGDWSGFEEVAMQDETKQAAEHFLSVAYDSLHRMLSNCFGADRQPEDALLVKIIDTWTLAAGFLVQNGLKKWDVYLEYSRESWSSLRDTAQTRKFTAYFLPKIIHSGKDIYQSNKSSFLGFWMRSLVERESMLKFQNEFTATLLDCDPENPLLSNLPFEKDPVTGAFKISQTEFRMRRLSLISSVLEKMRETYKAASGHGAAALKQEYAEILKAMMKAMKENFEALQPSTISGAYVAFVHRVVEFLLQYTTDIVEIDRFFTDSSVFPLPAMDPNYVVGQLKKYVFGLSFPGTQKQLNSFFQTLGERAALGHEQENLVGQLSTALSEDFEFGDPNKPTMRAYFLHAVFPAYIETALDHAAGWVLGVPVLKALSRVIANMRINMDSTNPACIQSCISMLATILDSMRRAASISMTSGNFTTPHILGTLTLLLNALAQALPLVAWIHDDADHTLSNTAVDCCGFLIRFALYARKIVTQRHDDEAQRPLDILAMSDRPRSDFSNGRHHCKDALSKLLRNRWQVGTGGAWSIGDRVVSPPRFPEGKMAFVEEVEGLVRAAARTEVFAEVVREGERKVWAYEGRGMPWSQRVEGRRQACAVRFLENLFC